MLLLRLVVAYCLCLGTVAISPCLAQGLALNDRLDSLEISIEEALRKTNAIGAGIAIVTREGPLLVRGFGKAHIERNVDASEHTIFRIASISKMFVALSILKLQEEGKIMLNDRVRDVVPEIEFTNPWEDVYPVRIVHLLEHTTGWDEYHLVEQTNIPLSLKEGLSFHPHSRRSRWVPGSRMAYSNSGAGVAGYIVEKISGKRYEEFVRDNFLLPLRMERTTFFNDEGYKRWGATLYDQRNRPMEYRHVIQRPAGAINSSPEDMANFVRFFLRRGLADSVRLIKEKSIVRMEVTKATAGSLAGLELGFGLANFSSVHKGFVFQGHNGGLPGALSELAYLPDHGIGHVILLNSSNGHALSVVSNLIRDFVLDVVNADVAVPERSSVSFSFNDGYYIPINPRIQWGYFLDRLIDVHRFWKADSVLVQSWLLPGAKHIYHPTSDSTFQFPGLDRVALVKATDPLEGDVLFTDSRVYAPIPAFIVFGQLVILGSWIVMMGMGSLVWVMALATYRSGRSRDALSLTGYPMLTTALFLMTIFLILYSTRFHSADLTRPGLLSLMITALSVWTIVSAVWSIVIIYRKRTTRVSNVTYWSMAFLATLHLVVVGYLMWFDVLPVISWA